MTYGYNKRFFFCVVGKATVDIDNTIPQAVRLKEAGVHVISVAVGGDHNVGKF